MVEPSWQLKGIPENVQVVCGKRVGAYDEEPGHEEPHNLHGSMEAQVVHVRNHPNGGDI
jgi:hypothetical protein